MDRGHGNEFFWQEGVRHTHDGWWDGPLHAIVFLLPAALLVVGVVWIIRRRSPGVAAAGAIPAPLPAAAIAADPAIAALRMRYARGDVSREEFQHAMADLSGASEPPPGGGGVDDDAATSTG